MDLPQRVRPSGLILAGLLFERKIVLRAKRSDDLQGGMTIWILDESRTLWCFPEGSIEAFGVEEEQLSGFAGKRRDGSPVVFYQGEHAGLIFQAFLLGLEEALRERLAGYLFPIPEVLEAIQEGASPPPKAEDEKATE